MAGHAPVVTAPVHETLAERHSRQMTEAAAFDRALRQSMDGLPADEANAIRAGAWVVIALLLAGLIRAFVL